MKKISLSKSLYMDGLRCPRLLYLKINRPDLAEPPDPQTQYLFATGHRVEEYARQLFPGGLLIGKGHRGPFARFLAETEEATATDAPFLYEAAFANGQMHCRTDILHRQDCRRWNIAEIKMSSRVKPEHIDDVSFQFGCVQDSGHAIDRAYLVYINNKYVRFGEIEPNKLFVSVDLTKEVTEKAISVRCKAHNLIGLVQEAVPPQAIIGSRCTEPGKCPFYKYCHDAVPEGSVYELPYGAKLIPLLLAKGIFRLADIPLDFPLSQRQAALVRSAKSGHSVVNVGAIKAFLQQLKHPLYFLDFETVNPCIPPYNNSSPYQKIPFQVSVHVQQTKGGGLEHYEFLPNNPIDPRKQLCDALIELLGDNNGTILAWNASFEKSVLSGLGERFPQVAGKIHAIISRVADLIIPFRSGAYSDFRFNGSASFKKVLPVLVPSLSYGNLAIGKGDDASLQFQKYVDGQMSDTEWSGIRKDLCDYCATDTLAMVKILDVLHKLS
jgi:hypothetical protein